MRTITFRRPYAKLGTAGTAKLIEIFSAKGAELHRPFLLYDTEGREEDIDRNLEYFVLIFERPDGQIFTTLRKHNPQNFGLYFKSIGQAFVITIER